MSHSRTILGALAALAVLAPAAQADPVSVKLRVEGKTGTLYEKPVTTDGHNVTTASGGTHKCDGTNGGANPSPGATSTATLDDGAKQGGFSFDATWNDGFEDFLIDRIGPDSSTSSEFWGHFNNFESSMVGGCQQRVGTGDEVLWVYDAFSKAQALNLTGPTSARTGQSFSVQATNGATGAPLAGASVGGQLTRRRRPRHAQLRQGRHLPPEGHPGRLGALAPADRVRRSGGCALVHQRRQEPALAPAAVVRPLRAATPATGPPRATSTISWQGDDGAGSGVSTYDVECARLRRRHPQASERLEHAAERHHPGQHALPRAVRAPVRVPGHRDRPGRQPPHGHRERPADPDRRSRPHDLLVLAQLEAAQAKRRLGPHGGALDPARRRGRVALPRHAGGAHRAPAAQRAASCG